MVHWEYTSSLPTQFTFQGPKVEIEDLQSLWTSNV